jgi:hypothetical protein
MMGKSPVVIVGIGEMGGVFARGFLRNGHPVFPVTRDLPLAKAATLTPDPEMVLLAVAENDLHNCLAVVPEPWRHRLCLLQNELLPDDWQQHGYTNPTVISVWFEKKKGQDVKVVIPSPAFGPGAELLHDSLGSIDIPVRLLDTAQDLLFELVCKNIYILTTNIAGLEIGGTVGNLWSEHRSLAEQVAGEVIQLQEKLTGQHLDHGRLISAMLEAFDGDPEHECMGRSAPARLQRALQLAASFGLQLATLRGIQQRQMTS